MPIKYPDFAERVQAAMAASGMTVNDIKSRLKITYEMARRYTLGQAMPRQEKMQGLADALNTDPAVLQFGIRADVRSASSAAEKVVSMGWPFKVSKSRYDKLPREEKDRIEGLIEHTITAWETKIKNKSRKAS